ncbi:MAG: DUF3015 domain-containing protein [Alphaproteobacteria bacterium]|nr:DUF3015 domain-containing protein [Alphaproteobacteria bacterium]
MNKTLFASLMLSVAVLSNPASALDSTGCGLGSMAWRGQSGIIPQVAAVTTNGIFGNQTFGITFGTSGCDPNGRVTGGTQKMILAFVENNMEQFAIDAAAGEGETLTTLAGILNMDEQTVALKTYQNFAVLFPDENVNAVDLTLKFYEIMKA